MKKLILFSNLWLVLCLSLLPLTFTHAANTQINSSSSNNEQLKSKTNTKGISAKDTPKSNNQSKKNVTEKKQTEKSQTSNSNASKGTSKQQSSSQNQPEKNKANPSLQSKSQKQSEKSNVSPSSQSKTQKDTPTQNKSVQANTASNSPESPQNKKTDSSTKSDENTFVEGNLSANDWKIELNNNSDSDDFSFIKGNQKTFKFFNNKTLVFCVSISLIALSFLGVVLFSLLYIRNSKPKARKKQKSSSTHFRVF